MKKLLTLLTALFTAVSLTACWSGPPEEPEEESPALEPVELVLWTYPVGNWGNATTVASLIGDFNRTYPHIRLSVECLDYTTGDQRIHDAISSGHAPDLVLEGPERLVANWGDRGLLADLSDLWESEQHAGEIYDFVKAACRHENGAYYEFPLCMSSHCMAINYELFEAAGALQYLDLETRTWTTEGFVNAVKALVAYGHSQAAAVYCNGQSGDQGTRALVNNLFGGSFTSPDHDRYTVNSPENIRALELLRDLEGIRFEPETTAAEEIARFCQGELAMAFCWNVSLEIQQTLKNPHKNFDIFPMAFPSETGEPRLEGGIWGFGVFDNGDEARVDAAKTFIRFMTDRDGKYRNAVLASTYWPVRDLDDLYANDAIMSEYSLFTEYMGDYIQITPGWVTAREAWWKMLQSIAAGTEVPAAAEAFSKAVDGS